MSTIHVTNWASRKLHRGRVWTIMANPRSWEWGEGTVLALRPSTADLMAVRNGRMLVAEYCAAYLDRVAALPDGALAPGRLMAAQGLTDALIGDGDTLCCACARSEAARGRCHRVWASEVLRLAGWSVVLDGSPFLGVTPDWAPLRAAC